MIGHLLHPVLRLSPTKIRLAPKNICTRKALQNWGSEWRTLKKYLIFAICNAFRNRASNTSVTYK